MFSSQTYEVIKERMLNDENIKKTGLATNEGSLVNSILSAKAVDEAKLYIRMGNLFGMAFIEDGFDEYLDKRINEFGIYRKTGEFATGTVQFTGTAGTQITNGLIIKVNGLEYSVIQDITLSDDAEKNISPIQANEVGVSYNVPANTEFTIDQTIAGLTSITAKTNIEGGIDPETDEEFKQRFYDTQRNNATSGNVAHYEQWAKEVDGVYGAKVTPLWDGPGTVKVAITGRGNETVSPQIIQNCKDYIESVRPIGADVTVVTPTLLKINITGTVELESGFDEDFMKAEVIRLVGEYLETETTEVTYSKVFGIIASLEAVNDCRDIQINGGTSNIKISDEQIPAVGTVTLSVGVV